MSDTISYEKAGVTTKVLKGGVAAFSLDGFVSDAKDVKTPDVNNNDGKRVWTRNGEWIKWGNDNNFPEHVMRALRESTVAKRILKQRANIHVGAGLFYYTKEVGENKEMVKVPLYIPEIEDFLDANNAIQTQFGLAQDLETWFNAMPMFRLSLKGDKIAAYDDLKMYYCRYGALNAKNKLDHVKFSYAWPNPTANKESSQIVDYPIFNKFFPLREKSFVMPMQYKTSDETIFYELAVWDSVRTNGWMDVERMVPEIKKHIFTNQAILKYHIKIPYEYWERKFGSENWRKLTIKGRQDAVDDELDKMDKFLANTKNSGKSFVSFYGHDPHTGKPYPGFEFVPIENKLKSDDYLPDASAAITAICFAMGYDPTNMGAVMTDKRGSGGSGSDKRETLANLQSSMLVDRHVSLDPLRLITRVNKWNEIYARQLNNGRIHWGYLDSDTSHTLDQKKPKAGEDASRKVPEEIHNG